MDTLTCPKCRQALKPDFWRDAVENGAEGMVLVPKGARPANPCPSCRTLLTLDDNGDLTIAAS